MISAVHVVVVRLAILLLALGLGTFGCAGQQQGKSVPSLPPAEPPQTFLEQSASLLGPSGEPPAPSLAFDGEQASLSLGFGGEQPVVVVFFATWCEPCSHKLRTVRRATTEVDGAKLLLVTVDDERTRHHVPGFLREHGIPEAPVLDGLENPEFLERYNPESALPMVVVLGIDGQPVDAQVGLRSGDGQRLENSLRLALLD